MCKPTNTESIENSPTKRVVIVGAGPAGLLASILLLRRNQTQDPHTNTTPKYQITLIDPGTNYGKLSPKDLQRKRSWMIGLSAHGLSAIQSVDGLYENYVRGLGVDIEKAVLALSPKMKFESDAKKFLGESTSAFTVDRNFVCAALARYLNEKYEVDPKLVTVPGSTEGDDDVVIDEFVAHYHTKALYVDYDKNRVLVRRTQTPPVTQEHQVNNSTTNDSDMFIDYDLIIGCDGIRSVVRNAIASTNRDFEFSISDTFGISKGLHIECPPNVHPGTFFLITDALPHMISFTLPETGNKLNVNLGLFKNRQDKIDPILFSKDVDGISSYFKKHFYAFDMDYDDVAQQWVNQSWNTIGQVHCNIYHDSKRNILLMGDAAHATSPQIGQGMNTALADAAAFDAILDSHKDDLSSALETFSEERVKEGNALTYLSFYTFSLSPSQQLLMFMEQSVRNFLHRCMPGLFSLYPMDEIPLGGKLSVAYDKMCKLGILQKCRDTNDKIIRDYFEKSCGMITEDESSVYRSWMRFVALSGVIVGVGVQLVPVFRNLLSTYLCN